MIKFFIFVNIRKNNCEDIFSDDRKEMALSAVRPGTKIYVAMGKETDDYDLISDSIYSLPYTMQINIRILTENDRLLFAQYSKVGTDEFGILSIERKKVALSNLFETGNIVVKASEEVIGQLKGYRYLARLEKDIDSQLEKLESPRLTESAKTIKPEAEEGHA